MADAHGSADVWRVRYRRDGWQRHKVQRLDSLAEVAELVSKLAAPSEDWADLAAVVWLEVDSVPDRRLDRLPD